MSLDAVSKNKIKGYLKNNSVNNLCYEDFYQVLGKKKYNDINFLTFFVDILINVFINNESISEKMLIKYFESVNIFLKQCLFMNVEVNFSLFNKIRSFRDKYNKYCFELGIDSNSMVISLIDEINGYFTNTCDKENSKFYDDKVLELEYKVLCLEQKLLNESKKNTILEEQIIKKDKKIVCLEELKKEKNILQLELDKVNKNNFILKKNMNDTLDSLSFVTKERDVLLQDNSRLSNKVDSQEKIISIFDEEYLKNARKDFLDNIILNILIDRKITFDGLLNKLKLEYKEFEFLESELIDSLKRVAKRFNISDKDIIAVPKEYGISIPNVEFDKKLILDLCDKREDILLISDMHIKEFDKYTEEVFDSIYDYCTIHGIKTILNLGDLLDSDNRNLEKNREVLNYNIDLLESIIKFMPYSNEITHGILGGNHDEDKLILGIDPIKYLSDSRSDVLNLGYENVSVYFGKNNEEFMMMHHKTIPLSRKCTMDYERASKKFNKNILEFYDSINKNRDNSYIDIFGHLHRSILDMMDSYCAVPPLKKGHSLVGAWHMKVYFDDMKNINYVIFIPLSYQKKLIPVSEQIYQKVKKI